MKNIFIALFLLAFSGSSATQHVIQLGVSPGLKSSSLNMKVFVGDTLVWEGDISKFPVNSTAVPEGAENFGASKGSNLYYVIMLAGDYEYEYFMQEFGYVTGKVSASFYDLPYIDVMSNASGSLQVVQNNGINVMYSTLNDISTLNLTLSIFTLDGKMFVNTPISLSNAGYVLPRMDRGMYIVRAVNERGEMYSTKMWQP